MSDQRFPDAPPAESRRRLLAHRWQPGDQVPILYLPERDYDSVVVAVE